MNPRRLPAQHDVTVSAERVIVRRDSSSALEAVHAAVRGALQLAILEGARVAVVLRGDATLGRPARVVNGVPLEILTAADGRERVSLRISEDSEQILLLERLIRVMPATDVEV